MGPTPTLNERAQRLADHTRLGLDSLFFGGSITHSHFLRELSVPEWQALLTRYEALTESRLKAIRDEMESWLRSQGVRV